MSVQSDHPRPLPQSESDQPPLPLDVSKLPKPFQSQVKKMQKFRAAASKLGNEAGVKHWDDKIQNLVEKINVDTRENKLDDKKLGEIKLKQAGKAVKKLRWLVNWVFKGIIHPSTALTNPKVLSKATPNELMNSDVHAYLDTPLLAVDFGDNGFVTNESISRNLNDDIGKCREEELSALRTDSRYGNEEDRKNAENAMITAIGLARPHMVEIQKKGKIVLETLQGGDPNKKIPIKDFRESMLQEFPHRSSLLGDARVDFAKADQELQKLLGGTSKRAERMYFYTSTYDQLDGAVIYPRDKPETEKEWKNPTLIFVGGNSSFFEHQVKQAQELADRYEINVVVYNGPGVGFSMGKERGEKDVIDAFKGVYTAITEHMPKNDKNQPDQDRIGVIGHSLGGGISAVGLGDLAKNEVIKGEQQPGLYINYHSFSSLSRVVANARSGSDWVVRQFIKMMGFGNMNAARTLQKHSIAKKVVLVSTDQDAIIKKYGQLAKDVGRLQKKGVEFASKDIDTVALAPLKDEEHVGMIAHNDLGGLTQEGTIANALNEWAKRAR